MGNDKAVDEEKLNAILDDFRDFFSKVKWPPCPIKFNNFMTITDSRLFIDRLLIDISNRNHTKLFRATKYKQLKKLRDIFEEYNNDGLQ